MSEDLPPPLLRQFNLDEQEAKRVRETLEKILENSPLKKVDAVQVIGSLTPELQRELINASKADPLKKNLADNLAKKVESQYKTKGP